MPGIAPAGVQPRSAAGARQERRRGKRLAKLYWRLRRPRLGEYAKAVAGIAICRIIAAVMVSLAITLYGFLGTVLGNMSYPRWPTKRSLAGGWAIAVAAAPAVVQLSHLVPAIVLFSIILIGIPRAHIWIFRLTLVGAVALGYYQRYLPPFPMRVATGDVTKRIALAASWAQLHLTLLMSDMQVLLAHQDQRDQQQTSWVVLVYVAASLMLVFIAYIFYRSAYILTLRKGSFFPRRPRSHNRSAFYVAPLRRRVMAVPVTAGLLSVDLWALQDIRLSLPAPHYGAAFAGYNHIVAIDCALAAFGAALIMCIPRPRGRRWLWIALLAAVTAYAVSTHVYLLHLPAWIPPPPQRFWIIVIIYLVVTGFCFDLVAALLDWPVYVPRFARRATRPTNLR